MSKGPAYSYMIWTVEMSTPATRSLRRFFRPDMIVMRMPTQITINVGLTDRPGQWAVVVTNPDGQHSEHYFDVRVEFGEGMSAPIGPVGVLEGKFLDGLPARFLTDNVSVWQIDGLDETQNYGKEEKDVVNSHAILEPFGRSKQEEGAKQLLGFLQSDSHLDLSKAQHIRWAAYMLATAYHETKFTWNPIQEEPGPDPWDYFESLYYGEHGEWSVWRRRWPSLPWQRVCAAHAPGQL